MIMILAIIAAALILITSICIIVMRRRPKQIRVEEFMANWKSLQEYCRDKSTWAIAIADADRLLENALRKKKFKGKSMGEKLVSAQRLFSNNDSVWFAHNLSKKLKDKPSTKLKEQDVKNALIGFRQALKDIGALPNGDVKDA